MIYFHSDQPKACTKVELLKEIGQALTASRNHQNHLREEEMTTAPPQVTDITTLGAGKEALTTLRGSLHNSGCGSRPH